jgi:hypothetical protein
VARTAHTASGFTVLDTQIVLSGPERWIRPINAAYARFLVPAESIAGAIRIELHQDNEENGETIRVDDRSFPIVSGLDTGIQLYQRFLLVLMSNIRSHAVLHAAALVLPQGGALLLAAPSGHGKSSQTLELVRRGLKFLSDDYAPLDLERREIHPYPRAVGVLPEGTAPIPESFRRASESPQTVTILGKQLVDIGAVQGEDCLANTPQPLRKIILLSSTAAASGDAVATTLLKVAARNTEAKRIEAALQRVEGVTILQTGELPELRIWELQIQHDRHPTRALSDILIDDAVIFTDKSWASRPDFDAEPHRVCIKRRETAQFLGRELLNRRDAGRFLERYDGCIPEMFLDLAGALADTDCWQVTVGRFKETADMIEEIARSE